MRSYLITLVFDLLGGVWAVDWVGSGSQACLTPLQLFKEARTSSIQGGRAGLYCSITSKSSSLVFRGGRVHNICPTVKSSG